MKNYNHNENFLKLHNERNVDEVTLKLQTKPLQVLCGHGLNQLFFTSNWNPSAPPWGFSRRSSPKPNFHILFFNNGLVHGRSLRLVDPWSFLCHLDILMNIEVASRNLHSREHSHAFDKHNNSIGNKIIHKAVFFNFFNLVFYTPKHGSVEAVLFSRTSLLYTFWSKIYYF